jgi:nucleotide-binding universal stress UspA family protein
MKKILVPTDFSDCSIAAIDYAARIARKMNGEIHLLHVVDVPTAESTFSVTGEWGSHSSKTTSDTRYMMGLMEETKVKMKKLKALSELQGLQVFDHAGAGSIVQNVNDFVVKHQIDLIIMGTQGTSGISEVFIGSNTEKIVRNAAVPVIAIKNKARKDPQLLAFASDFSEGMDKIFPAVKRFAAVFDAKIHLVKVNTMESFETSRESKKLIKKFLKRIDDDGDYEVTSYNDMMKEEGIIHFAQDYQADLIIMGNHGNQGISHFFNGSLSEDIVNHAFCPVMTFHVR